MGILSRPRFLPQQRLDLEDVSALLSALRTDSKLYTANIVSANNLIFNGFSVTGLGLKAATVVMAGATLVIPQNTTDFSWFTAAPAEPNIVIPDADLTDNTRNYVEISLVTENNTPLTKAFWDPESNSGAGSEFNQIVDTITDLAVNIVVSTGGFSGSPDRLPLCIIDTDASGNIKTIFDRRRLFGRLATPDSLGNRFSWGTKVEPVYSLTMTGESGTFVAGETITIGTETATVVTGGTTSITFNSPSGLNFFPGGTVTGGTSSATGTISTISESFTGVDKNIKNYKDAFDALATEFASVKGTTYWWQDAQSSISGMKQALESTFVQAVVGSTFSWNGSVLSIGDTSIGSPANADVLGYIRMMGRSGNLSMTRQDGTGGSTTLAVAEGQVLFVKIPTTGSRAYSGLGSGDTNYQVASISSYTSSDQTYWIAYRELNRLYVRGYGELESGETIPIGDPDREDILASIAANQVKENQDRTLKLIEGGTWSLNNAGTTLTFSADAYIQVPGLLRTRNTITAGNISLPNATSVAYVEILKTAGGTSTLTVVVANEDAVTLTDNTVIIARRVTAGVRVGTHSFLLKANEYLELDGALAEIDRYFGLMKVRKHESAVNKARIDSSNISMLNGDTFSKMIGTFLLNFSGAVINFTTGTINKEDDSTALGVNFTPFSIPSNQYFWYGIALTPVSTDADNREEAQVVITQGSSANASASVAPKPNITGQIPLAMVQIFNNSGTLNVFAINRFGMHSSSLIQDSSPILSADLEVNGKVIKGAANEIVLAGQNAVRRAKAASPTSFVEEEYINSIALSGSQTNTVITNFTFAFATFEGLEITYKIHQTTTNSVRIGTLRVVTNGTLVSYTDTFNDTSDLGISFDAVVNGSNINIRYTSGTNGGTMRADVKKFAA